MKKGINFTNAQLFVAGLMLIGLAFLSLGLFPSTIINQVNFNEVGVIQYLEGSGVKTFDITSMVSRYPVEIPSWINQNKNYKIEGYMKTSSNGGPLTDSLIIDIPACNNNKVVLKDEGGSQSKIVTTCTLGEVNGVQQRYAFKVVGFQKASNGDKKWNVAVYVPSVNLVPRVCEEGEKVYDTCWNGETITLKECKNNAWKKISSCPEQTNTPGQNLDTGTGGEQGSIPTEEDYEFVNNRPDNATYEDDIIKNILNNNIALLLFSFGGMLSLISGVNLLGGKR